jgi:hypothetical protein
MITLFGINYIQCGIKQGDALSSLLFNFASKVVLRKLQENQVGFTLYDGLISLRVMAAM